MALRVRHNSCAARETLPYLAMASSALRAVIEGKCMSVSYSNNVETTGQYMTIFLSGLLPNCGGIGMQPTNDTAILAKEATRFDE